MQAGAGGGEGRGGRAGGDKEPGGGTDAYYTSASYQQVGDRRLLYGCLVPAGGGQTPYQADGSIHNVK